VGGGEEAALDYCCQLGRPAHRGGDLPCDNAGVLQRLAVQRRQVAQMVHSLAVVASRRALYLLWLLQWLLLWALLEEPVRARPEVLLI
jgi:hypothetical protein